MWLNDHVAYRCKDCGMTESSCMCVDCFDPTDHEGHDFRIYKSLTGGCCDCGDPNAWRPSGYCRKHRLQISSSSRSSPSPLSMDTKGARRAFRALCCEMLLCIGDVLQFTKTQLPGQYSKKLEAVAAGGKLRDGMVLEVPHIRGYRLRKREENCKNIAQLLVSIAETTPRFRKMIGEVFLETHKSLQGNSMGFIVKYAVFLEDDSQEQLGIFVLRLLIDDSFKIDYAKTFVTHYGFLLDNYLYGSPSVRRSITRFLDRILCQLCNSTVQVATLVYGGANDMLGIICDRLLSLSKRCSKRCTLPVGNPPDAKHHPLPPLDQSASSSQLFVLDCDCDSVKGRLFDRLVMDIWLLFVHENIVEDAILRREDVLEKVLGVLTLLQEMNPQTRKVGSDAVYEPRHGWEAALVLELDLVYALFCLVEGYENILTKSMEHGAVVKRVLGLVTQKVAEWLCGKGLVSERFDIASRNRGSSEEYIIHNIVDKYKHKVSSPTYPTSIHIPLHRFWAGIYYETLRVCDELSQIQSHPKSGLSFVSSLLDTANVVPKAFECFLAQHALSVVVKMAQVNAGVWVRNGTTVEVEPNQYYSKQWSATGIDLDIFILQLAASVMPSDDFVRMVVKRFELENSLSFARDGDVDPEMLNENQKAYACEFMFHFLGVLVHDRTRQGETLTASLRKQVIHILASGNSGCRRTFSSIEGLIHNSLLGATKLETVLQQVADYMPPSLNDEEGSYILKDGLLEDVSIYFSHYTVEEQQNVEENFVLANQRNGKSASKAVSLISLRPSDMLFSSFSHMPSNILCNGALHSYMFKVLFACACDKKQEDEVSRTGVLTEVLRLLFQGVSLSKSENLQSYYKSRAASGTVRWKWGPKALKAAFNTDEVATMVSSSEQCCIGKDSGHVRFDSGNPLVNMCELVAWDDGPAHDSQGVESGSMETWQWPKNEGGDVGNRSKTLAFPLHKIAPTSSNGGYSGISMLMLLLQIEFIGRWKENMHVTHMIESLIGTICQKVSPYLPVDVICNEFRCQSSPGERRGDNLRKEGNKRKKKESSKKAKRQAKIMADFKKRQAAFLDDHDHAKEDSTKSTNLSVVQNKECAWCREQHDSMPMGMVAYCMYASISVPQEVAGLDGRASFSTDNEKKPSMYKSMEDFRNLMTSNAPSVLSRADVNTSTCLFKGCGHYMHFDCYARYQGSLVQGSDVVVDVREDEYRCPMCRSLANILIPVVPNVDEYWQEVRKEQGEKTVISSGVDQFFAKLGAKITSTTGKQFLFTTFSLAVMATENMRLTMCSQKNNENANVLQNSRATLDLLISAVRWYLHSSIPEHVKLNRVSALAQDLFFEDESIAEVHLGESMLRMQQDTMRILVEWQLLQVGEIAQTRIFSVVAAQVVFAIALAQLGVSEKGLSWTESSKRDANTWIFTKMSGAVDRDDIPCESTEAQKDDSSGIQLVIGSLIDELRNEMKDDVSIPIPEMYYAQLCRNTDNSITFMELLDNAQKFLALLDVPITMHLDIPHIRRITELYCSDLSLVWRSSSIDPDVRSLLSFALVPRLFTYMVHPYPQLLQLPSLYTSLYLRFCKNVETPLVCEMCTENISADVSMICLFCGDVLCMRENCRVWAVSEVLHRHTCTCNRVVCHSVGAFLPSSMSAVYITLGKARILHYGSIYLDSHGEEDPSLRRGKPLYLSELRYEQLRRLVSGLGFVQDTKTLRKFTNTEGATT
mmetsp:Transcript_23783/g.51701  ORF Transcript_23783/g.51701 Transcript_23783/m.51701 type:complete len:1715 (-) Transcript_23783:3049-8193(-)